MNNSTPRLAAASSLPSWTITDPSAPSKPEAPAAPAAKPRPRAARRRYSYGYSPFSYSPYPALTWVLVCVAVLIEPRAPQAILNLMLHLLGFSAANAAISPALVRVIAALALAAKVAGPTLRCISAQIAAARTWRARAAARKTRDECRAWREQHQLDRAQLPDGPVRETADRLVEALGEIESSRSRREGLVDDDWTRTLQALQWSILTRERASTTTRARLAEAAQLAEHNNPQLAAAERDRRAELADLDGELAGLADQAEALRDLVRNLDQALAAAAKARALSERAAALAQQLGADPLTAEDHDDRLRQLHAQALAEGGPRNDLTILAAQLRALTRHFATDTAAAQPE